MGANGGLCVPQDFSLLASRGAAAHDLGGNVKDSAVNTHQLEESMELHLPTDKHKVGGSISLLRMAPACNSGVILQQAWGGHLAGLS